MAELGSIGQYIKAICKPKNLKIMFSPSGLRALRKLFEMAALMAAALPAQLLVAGPIFHDRDTVPRLMGRAMTRIMGLDVKFTGVAPDQRGSAIYIANHVSWTDPFVMAGRLKGAFVASTETGRLPLVGRFGQSAGGIFVERNSHGAFLEQNHRRTATALNEGRNIVLFPEGKYSGEADILPFKHGILSVLFNNASDVKLERDVRVQPFATTITSVDGKPVTGSDALRDIFSWYSYWTPENFWKVLEKKSIGVEVTGLPVMDPKDYADRYQFIAAAEKAVRDRVLAPLSNDMK